MLISGLNVAGDEMTSPNFWSKVLTKDAEQPATKTAEPTDTTLRDLITKINDENTSIRSELDPVLRKLNLASSAPVTSVPAVDTPNKETLQNKSRNSTLKRLTL